MFVTELTSHELSGWLKAAALLNILCAHAAREFGNVKTRGATGRRVARRGAAMVSRCGAAAGRDAHRGRGARRTFILVTEPTSHESSGWLKAAAFANMLCAHAARGVAT